MEKRISCPGIRDINFSEISGGIYSNTVLCPLRGNSSDSSAIYLSARQINHRSIFFPVLASFPLFYPARGASPIRPRIAFFGPLGRNHAPVRPIGEISRIPIKPSRPCRQTRVRGPPRNAKNVSARTGSACEICSSDLHAHSLRPRSSTRALGLRGPEIIISTQREI